MRATQPSPPSELSLPSDPTAALEQELESLQALDLDDLRSRWRQRLRCPPPPGLSRPLLLRLLAYRLQARLWGDLDPEAARALDRIARDKARQRLAAGKHTPKAVPPVPPVPPCRPSAASSPAPCWCASTPAPCTASP